MQVSAVLNIFIGKHNLILFLQMISKEKIFWKKCFIVTDLVSLTKGLTSMLLCGNELTLFIVSNKK